MKKYISKLQRALYFLRITDDDGLLSITHIACGVVLYKIATASQPNITDMGSLLIVLSLYYGKAHIRKNKEKVSDDNNQIINDLKLKVQQVADKTSSLAASMGFRPKV